MCQIIDNNCPFSHLPLDFLRTPFHQRTLYFGQNIIPSDSEIRANVYKSLMLNSLSLLSIYIFDLLLQPLVQHQQKWFHRNIGWFYHVLWLFPVVGTSLYLNVRQWLHFLQARRFGAEIFISRPFVIRAPGARSSRSGHTCSSTAAVRRRPSQRRTRECCARWRRPRIASSWFAPLSLFHLR